MPTTWGVSDTGFYRPTYEEVRAKHETRWKSQFGGDRKTKDSDGTLDAHFISLMATAESRWWEAEEAAYNSRVRGTAGGVNLDALLEPLIGKRKQAKASKITLTLTGDPATLVEAPKTVELDSTKTQWVLDEDATIGGGGTITAQFTCSTTGPNAASAGSTWNILTPVTGWDTATNPATSATLGQDRETDSEYRDRARRAVKHTGLALALLALDGVTAVRVFENDTDSPDAYWGATHWFEVLVVGGDDDEIAQTIWDWKEGTAVTAFGNTSGTAVDSQGNSRTVKFSRSVAVTVYVDVAITKGEGYPSTSQVSTIQAGLEAWATENLGDGDDVSPFQVGGAIAELVPGIGSAVIKVDTVSPPASTSVLVVADRQVASIVAGNVTVSEA